MLLYREAKTLVRELERLHAVASIKTPGEFGVHLVDLLQVKEYDETKLVKARCELVDIIPKVVSVLKEYKKIQDEK